MKTLIILLAHEEYLEYIPSVRADVILYIGEMNTVEDNDAPENLICYKGELTPKNKEYIKRIAESSLEVNPLFIEIEGEPDMPDDSTLIIKSK